MKKFVIERNLPGAGNLSEEELREISKMSSDVMNTLEDYHWVQTFVTEDKLYCIHIARNIEQVREHARLGNFPINTISEVQALIDAYTGDPK